MCCLSRDNGIALQQIDWKTIDRVQRTSFRGVIFTNQLSWKTHICHVASKKAKTIGIIHKSKYFLPNKSFLSLYHSLVYRYHYNLDWDSTYKTNFHWPVLFQKRTVRIIGNKDYRALLEPSFKNLKI